jgi:WD40 repeat protein
LQGVSFRAFFLRPLTLYDVCQHTHCAQVSAADVPDALGHFWTAALHPKDPHLALVAGGNSVQLWDTSSSSSTGAAVAAGRKLPVRDVCWAPHNEHRFVTGGDDGKLRFWDTRCVGWGEVFRVSEFEGEGCRVGRGGVGLKDPGSNRTAA